MSSTLILCQEFCFVNR